MNLSNVHSILSENVERSRLCERASLSEQNKCVRQKQEKYFLDVQFFIGVFLIQASNQKEKSKRLSAFSRQLRRRGHKSPWKTNQLEQKINI